MPHCQCELFNSFVHFFSFFFSFTNQLLQNLIYTAEVGTTTITTTTDDGKPISLLSSHTHTHQRRPKTWPNLVTTLDSLHGMITSKLSSITFSLCCSKFISPSTGDHSHSISPTGRHERLIAR